MRITWEVNGDAVKGPGVLFQGQWATIGPVAWVQEKSAAVE